MVRRVSDWRAAGAAREAERRLELTRQQALAIREQERLKDAIRVKRDRETHASPAVRAPEATPTRPEAPAAATAAAPAKTKAPAPPAAPAERVLTAAERLALKRRERR